MTNKRKHTESFTGFTYGFGRAQFVANLISGTMLVALCLTLSLESLQHMYETSPITMPPVVVGELNALCPSDCLS